LGRHEGHPGRNRTICNPCPQKWKRWFLGTITNNDARELKIPLSFLPKGKTYEASIYSDDATVKTRTKVSIQKVKVNSTTVLDAKMIGSGGQAVWIRPMGK